MYTGSISATIVTVRRLDSVRKLRYFWFFNVLQPFLTYPSNRWKFQSAVTSPYLSYPKSSKGSSTLKYPTFYTRTNSCQTASLDLGWAHPPRKPCSPWPTFGTTSCRTTSKLLHFPSMWKKLSTQNLMTSLSGYCLKQAFLGPSCSGSATILRVQYHHELHFHPPPLFQRIPDPLRWRYPLLFKPINLAEDVQNLQQDVNQISAWMES